MLHKFIVFDKNYHKQSISFKSHNLRVRILDGQMRDITIKNAYGYVCSGTASIFSSVSANRHIQQGDWFSINSQSSAQIYPGNKTVVFEIMEQPKVHKPFAMGEVTEIGVLGYIDGATNTLLYGPIKKGEPCLNCLHIEGQIDQTPHTHPSPRVGYVLKGQIIVKIWDKEGDGAAVVESYILDQGDVWAMGADVVHSFHKFTDKTQPVAILAFHPDSDFGPTDEVAPMINRTIVHAQSASILKNIHTRKDEL